MTREETIQHWAEDVIPAVFKAEDAMQDKLKKILAENKDNSERAAKLYCQAIAEEIVSHTPDSAFDN